MTTQPHREPHRVVLVDDTLDLRELLCMALTRGGFEVVGEAGDGRQGIEVCEREHPDIVLLDLAMPVMDGIEALPDIRRSCPAALIVVLSGFGAQQMAARAMAAGADGYVQKGASLKKILGYVRDLVDGATSRPAPALALVSPGAPATVPPATVPAAADPAAADPVTPAGLTGAWTDPAVTRAPYGVLEVADETLALLRLNPAAERLLGRSSTPGPLQAPPGTRLDDVADELATVVREHRGTHEAAFEVEGPRGRLRVTQFEGQGTVLLFLDAAPEEARLLRRAIATAAHEIRGPVTVLAGVAETVGEMDDMDPSDRRRMMQSVVRQTRLLDGITADLLTSAQIQRGTLRLERKSLDPAEAVAAAVNGAEAVVTVLDHRRVDADPLRFEQMLTNLLRNAVKYGAPPYEIVVRPATRPDLVCIEVIDHGPGVPRDFEDRLFLEYARAEHDGVPGNGLGLFVVRTLAEAQGGSAGFRRGDDGGAVFSICLPAVATETDRGPRP